MEGNPELIEERKRKAVTFLKEKISWIVYIFLAIIIWINVHIRTLPMKMLSGTGHPGLWDITRNNWTLGPDLDPFLFLRYAKNIVENGSLMAVDFLRNVPLGFRTATETRLLPYMMAWLYEPVKWFKPDATVEYAAVVFPVVMSVFTAIFFFLLVRKIFEERGEKVSGIIALISTFFMVVLPSLLSRTIAGIPEKESAGFTFFFAAFYFFLAAWKSKKLSSGIILGILAGVFSALMGHIWGAWVFLFIVIAASVFLAFILGKVGKKELLIYSLWLISTLIFYLPFTERVDIRGLIASPSSSLAFGIWFILLVDLVLFKIKKIKRVEEIKEKTKIPEQIISIVASIILLIIVSSIFFGIGFIPGEVKDVVTHLTIPYEDRIAFTVAENRQPYFTEWAESFGPTALEFFKALTLGVLSFSGTSGQFLSSIPLFFWLFFAGSIFLFFAMVKDIEKKDRVLLTLCYSIFIFSLVFSRYSPSFIDSQTQSGVLLARNFYVFLGTAAVAAFMFLFWKYKYKKEEGTVSKAFIYLIIALSAIILIVLALSLFSGNSSPSYILNGENSASKVIYFGGFLLIFLLMLFLLYLYNRENKLEELKKIDFNYLLIFMLFFLTIVAARSAVRLIMVLAPVAAIIIGYFITERIASALKEKSGWRKSLGWTIAIIVLLASLYTLNYNYQVTSTSAQGYIPYSYTYQWQKAMDWVRNNTPQDAIFSHWWDYGYWVQTMGERATVLDGGNAIGYWNHLMGRHVLTGKTELEAMEFMYTHNSDYLLIDSTEIGKYAAYSSIGGDENYDRYSWIGTYVLNPDQTQETKNETVYLYQGGITTDQDIVWSDNSTGTVTLPAQRTVVAGILLPIADKNGSMEFNQPTAIYYYNGKYIRIPMRYLYYEGKRYDFLSGMNLGLFIMPRINQNSDGTITVNNMGVALFLSSKNLDALWVRLYLLGEGKSFELVHNEPNLMIDSLGAQGLKIGDFAFYNDVLGPIKIWKANFPEDIKANPEYLERAYPNVNLSIAKKAF